MTYRLKTGRRVEAHPAADAFPMLSADAISVLAADITTHGQRVPVILQRGPSGVDWVLDGRNRLLACEQADVEPLCHYVEPDAPAVSLIVSVNMCRRHQGESQRAMSAARLGNVLRRGRPKVIASIEAITQPHAAGMFHVSRSAVQRAAAVLKDEILTAAVDAGHVTVSDAYQIRNEPAAVRQRAVAAVSRGDARTLRAALAREAPGTPSEGASEDAAARRPARLSEPSRPVSDSADAMEPPKASASDRASHSSSKSKPVEPSASVSRGSEYRPAGPAESSSGSLPLPGRSDVTEPPESGSASDSSTESSPAGIPMAVPAAELGQRVTAPADELRGGDDASDSPPLLPTSNEGADAEASDVAARELNDAAVRTGDGEDSELRRRLEELTAAADRLASISAPQMPRFRAACQLVQTLASALDRCLDARMDDSVLVAGLPEPVVASLEAQFPSDHAAEEGVGVDVGKPVPPSMSERAGKPRPWLGWLK